MNASQIHTTYKTITRLLVIGQLKSAFDKIADLTNKLQIGMYIDRSNELQQNYRYLLQYYVDNVEDPQRKLVYNKLIAHLFVLVNELREELLVNNSSNYEYSTKRYFQHQPAISTGKLIQSLSDFHKGNALLSESPIEHTDEIFRLRSNYETTLPLLFSVFWLKTAYTSDDKTIAQQILSPDYQGDLEKCLLVSAVTLNLWRMFDKNKLFLLFDASQSSDEQISQRAVVGLCFVLAKYNRFLPYFPSIRNRLMLLTDDTQIVEDFKNIIFQIINTSETESIAKKMQDEILPEIANRMPLITNKEDIKNLLKSEDWEEENPQWMDFLEQNGISDKLQELTELQMEGADIYMNTFSMLKNYPFFSEISNWFLPFDTNHSQIRKLFTVKDKNPSMTMTFASNSAMCNSDKYSLSLCVLQMPEQQRELITSSLNMENEQMEELSKEEALLTPERRRKNISKQYLQDLYRFFKLNTNCADFSNMFASSLFMHHSYLFDILSANSDIKKTVAEYYFHKKLYEQALELFPDILKETEPTASLYQKIGYAYQKTSQIEKALDAYLKADIIQPDENWTIRKIALCYRMLGNFEKALENYLHVDFLQPNKAANQMNIARCYIELKKYKEAFAIYHKLCEKSENDTAKLWRTIVWSSFISENLSQGEYYAEKIMEFESEPIITDYIVAGHIAWCRRNLKKAKVMYKSAWETKEQTWESFVEQLMADKQYLIANGLDEAELPLLIDEIQYTIQS